MTSVKDEAGETAEARPFAATGLSEAEYGRRNAVHGADAACGIVVFVVWTCGERTTAITISVAGVLVWLLGRVLRYFFSGKFSKLGKFGS